MIKLKNPRAVRLIDGKGRFDLRPGEVVELKSLPADLESVVERGILLEVKPKPKAPTNKTPQKIAIGDQKARKQTTLTNKPATNRAGVAIPDSDQKTKASSAGRDR